MTSEETFPVDPAAIDGFLRRSDGRSLGKETIERRLKFYEMAKAGASVEEMSSQLGISIKQLTDQLNRFGLRVSQRAISNVMKRRERIRELIAAGWSVERIAEEVQMHIRSIRNFVNRESIDVPSDIGAIRRQRNFDSNRIMAQIVTDAETMVSHLKLVKLSDLDQNQITEWSRNLSASVRSLRQFSLQLKSMRPLQ